MKDASGKWVVAQVVGATETAVTLKARDRATRWDEEFSRESSRLAGEGVRDERAGLDEARLWWWERVACRVRGWGREGDVLLTD